MESCNSLIYTIHVQLMARVLSQLSSFLQSLTHSTHTTSHAHVPHHAKHDKQTSMLWALALYRVIYYSMPWTPQLLRSVLPAVTDSTNSRFDILRHSTYTIQNILALRLYLAGKMERVPTITVSLSLDRFNL